MPIIAPSLLSADFVNLQRDCELISKSKADWFHLDVMDGIFVPNISFGIPIIEAINHHVKKPLDVHLMIVKPERYIADFRAAGSNHLTVHYETSLHLHRTLEAIHKENMKAGVALNPHTSVHLLKEVINETDIVCIMSVNPGFGEQRFIENTYQKVRELKEIIQTKNASTLIEIDGGVNLNNAKKLIEYGADVLVVGSFVFKSENPLHAIADLKTA